MYNKHLTQDRPAPTSADLLAQWEQTFPENVKNQIKETEGESVKDSHLSKNPHILRKIVQKLIGEREDFKDSLQRLKADFENYKRRVAEREQQIADQASADLAEKLIPVLDSLEAAMSSDAASGEDGSGMEQIAKLLFSVLEAEGMAALKPEGDVFDPNLHEAVEHIPADNSSSAVPVVVEVFRTGYTWKGRLLRPAMVKVQG